MVTRHNNEPGRLQSSVQHDLGLLLAGKPDEVQQFLTGVVQWTVQTHQGQQRAAGEPYDRYFLAVARILDDLGLDSETLAAAILHEVVEDSRVTLEDIAREFGAVIARLVAGVARMERISEFQGAGRPGGYEHRQAENLRKMLLAMAEDVRVVFIKLAERLHIMRTLRGLEREEQLQIARETLDIYAPLANRLGIWQIKWELEDLALRCLEPERYQELVALVDETRSGRESYIRNVIEQLDKALVGAGIAARVTGRPKHIYSIYRKMQNKGVDFEQIFDMRAVRVIVEKDEECYAVLGIVHGKWRHIPSEFDDYIANPKENRYRSLHTAVIGPEGRTLEVQIRTETMDRHAELGIAAHWRYKEGGRQDADYEEKIAWLRQLLEWHEDERGATDFVDRFKSEAFQDRVYVLTPQGKIVDLPMGATPLDFAYAIHSEVGHRCRGARVNGRITPLTYTLNNADQVEVLTAKQGTPSRDWLNIHLGYLKTSRARSRVRQWFKQQDYEHNIAAGRSILDRELHRLGITGLAVERLAGRLRQRHVDECLAAIGRGDISTGQIAAAVNDVVPVREKITGRQTRIARKSSSGPGEVSISGVGNLLTIMARCCHPVPNDPIVGYITRGRGVTIHRRDCGNVLRLPEEDRDRLIEVEWGSSSGQSYLTDILVEAYDRPGLLRDITTVLANEKINVNGVRTDTDADGIAHMSLSLEISDIAQLSRVLMQISRQPNVVDARRRV